MATLDGKFNLFLRNYFRKNNRNELIRQFEDIRNSLHLRSKGYTPIIALDFDVIYAYLNPWTLQVNDACLVNFFFNNTKDTILLLPGTVEEIGFFISRIEKQTVKVKDFIKNLEENQVNSNTLKSGKNFVRTQKLGELDNKCDIDFSTILTEYTKDINESLYAIDKIKKLIESKNIKNPQNIINESKDDIFNKELFKRILIDLNNERDQSYHEINNACDAKNIASVNQMNRILIKENNNKFVRLITNTKILRGNKILNNLYKNLLYEKESVQEFSFGGLLIGDLTSIIIESYIITKTQNDYNAGSTIILDLINKLNKDRYIESDEEVLNNKELNDFTSNLINKIIDIEQLKNNEKNIKTLTYVNQEFNNYDDFLNYSLNYHLTNLDSLNYTVRLIEDKINEVYLKSLKVEEYEDVKAKYLKKTFFNQFKSKNYIFEIEFNKDIIYFKWHHSRTHQSIVINLIELINKAKESENIIGELYGVFKDGEYTYKFFGSNWDVYKVDAYFTKFKNLPQKYKDSVPSHLIFDSEDLFVEIEILPRIELEQNLVLVAIKNPHFSYLIGSFYENNCTVKIMNCQKKIFNEQLLSLSM
jgi:hypothetical protein